MTRIEYKPGKVWENYHKTEKIWVEQEGTYESDLGSNSANDLSGPDRFAATASPLLDFVAKAKTMATGAGMLGIGWSFAPLIGMPRLQLDLQKLSGCSPAHADELSKRCPYPIEDIAFVSGGTNLRTIVEWAKPRGKMMFTSGTHLAPTIAGGAGTSTHGSRLGYGGLQNQIIGMHIITGDNSSVWLERRSRPVLKRKIAKKFADRSIRSDKMFEDALIHLGGMGIINGVALELTDYKTFHVLADDHALWPDWLAQMRDGDFRAIARELGHDAEPTFYEVTINPANYMGPQALHTCYFEKDADADGTNVKDTDAKGTKSSPDALTALKRPADAICHICEPQNHNSTDGINIDPDNLPPDFNLLALYAAQFFDYHKPPINTASPGRGWEDIHDDVITGGSAGALYNASYAVDRRQIDKVIPLICKAVEHIPATFIFTMRFVSQPAGTLAFTRFAETVVIEIDGISENAPDFGQALGQFTRTASLIVREALDAAGIDYSMHWAKLGEVDASKMERDFGPSSLSGSRISRWRETRNKLLQDDCKSVFWNRALRNYGLV